MGGCCCTARSPHIHGSPVYYCYPYELEANRRFAAHSGTSSAFTAGLFVELELNNSTPDTFRPPPAPLPYEVLLPARSECLQKHACSIAIRHDIDDSDCKSQSGLLPVALSPKNTEVDEGIASATEEEETCAICLEEYGAENPKLITKCRHHFHLSCIVEWLERSDACPMCDQVCFLGSS